MDTYEGNCSCGKIEYHFEGEPINSAFCYCRECQMTTGSDKWFGLWVPKNKLSFTKGVPKIFIRTGNSGKAVNINFCGNCNTTLCAEVTVGDFYSVAASTLQKFNSFSPKMAIYVSSAPKWAVFPENVPKFDILPPNMVG